MGRLASCLRIVVIVWNCLLMIVGLSVFAGGLFLRFGDSAGDRIVDGKASHIERSLNSSGFGLAELDVDWSSVLFETALILTFCGLGIIIVTVLGCCGACYVIKCMIISYVVVCSLLLVGQAVTVGLIYGSPKMIQDSMKDDLKKGIQSDYGGLNGTNLVTQAWNIVMLQMKCCGVDSYEDFTGASNWIIDYTSNTPSVTLKTPLACCKTLPTSEDFTCAGSSASSTDNYLNTGCFDEVWDFLFGNKTTGIAVFCSICGLQLLLIILSAAILCSDTTEYRNKVRPVVKPKPPKDTKIIRPAMYDRVSFREMADYKSK